MRLRFLWRGLKTYFRDQRSELLALQSALRPGDVAVDVGANKGSYVWALSRAVSQGRVVAFEPQPALAAALRDDCWATGLKNVQVEHAAVSQRSGRMVLAIPGNKLGSPGASLEESVRTRKGASSIEVNVTSLDEYFASEQARVGAIKIDVEGHELAVLRGAAEIIRRDRPLIVCECEARNVAGGRVEALFDWFSALKFEGQFVHRQRLRPVSEFTPDVHQSREGKRYWDRPDYCNNFIFRPAA